jgi:hypothetical protein
MQMVKISYAKASLWDNSAGLRLSADGCLCGRHSYAEGNYFFLDEKVIKKSRLHFSTTHYEVIRSTAQTRPTDSNSARLSPAKRVPLISSVGPRFKTLSQSFSTCG